MRVILAAGILLATSVVGHAQVQEKKLLDRLLEPNMTLQNSAQGKQFTAGGSVTTKKAATKSFYVADRPAEKNYTNLHSFGVREFATTDSRFAHRQASTATRNSLTNLDTPYATFTYATRDARDAQKMVAVNNYPGARPFLVHGKSQKSLNTHNRPMSIDEVRELLNKNK